MVATTITILGTRPSPPAAADTPLTFLNETFQEASFPPANWSVPLGTWSSSCPAPSPGTGCAAVSDPAGAVGVNELFFNPSSGIPSNLQNVTLSFYSDFSPDATSNGDNTAVMQASCPGCTGDFNTLVPIDTPLGSDATGTPVLHSVTLPNDNLPIVFYWSSSGDSSSSPTSSWAISNVTITGTVPATGYTLTANPIDNTVYPNIVAGTPVTIHLSGSSSPDGDALQFSISTPPTVGTLGPITQVDATDATVVYSPPISACPDPNGVPGYICADVFYFTVHDIEGNVSSPAKVDLQMSPGGANGVLPAVSAPPTAGYEQIFHSGSLVNASDLSGSVTVGPPSFPDEIQLELQASTGTIDLVNGDASGVTFIDGTSSDAATIVMTGSATKVNEALGEFLYFPPSGTTPTATINMFPTDMGPTSGGPFTLGTEVTTTIQAGAVTPPAPSLALPTQALAVATNAGPLTFNSGPTDEFVLTDAGASSTTQDEVALSVNGGSLALPASDTSGATQIVTAQSLSGGSSLDLTGSVANLNRALLDLTFDPTGLFSQTVTLSAYAIDPGTTETSPLSASVPITVTEAPFAFGATSFTTLENSPATVWLCADGPSGDPLSFTITTPPSNGTLVADPSAAANTSGCSQTLGLEAFTYTPGTGYTGPDSFTYSITDATTGLVSTGNTVSITVNAHQKPTAYDVSANTTEDTPVTITLCGQNPEAAVTPSLTFAITGGPLFGSLSDQGRPTINPCNQGNVAENYLYTPNAHTFTSDGTDTFSYTVSNGTVSSPATGTVYVATLTPQVASYSASVDEDSSIELNLCSTAPASPITFSIVAPPTHGSLDQQLAAGNGPACPSGYFNFGTERYVPDQLYSGTDGFWYTASAGGRTSQAAFVSLTINKVEIPPVATAQTVTDLAPHPVAIILSGTSLQGSTLNYRVVTFPTRGTLSGTAPNLTYTPSIGNGTDSFTFVANDGVADSPPATVTIDVTTPQLTSNVCYAGAPLDPNLIQFACSGNLTAVASPQFGAIDLAHTSGAFGNELRLQQSITNQSTAADTVTLTAPAGTSQWPFFYDENGFDVTSQITGPGGLQVTLGPIGSSTATIYVQMITIAPWSEPAPAVVSTHVLATSGNDPAVSTELPIMIQDGTSSPDLQLAQANGSGLTSFPDSLQVSPPLYDGGPAGGVDILAGMGAAGTGINTFAVSATVEPGSTPGITPTFFLGTTNVTSAVLAGTEVITCYAAPVGCPPMHAVLTPGATGSGFFSMLVSLTSTIDGQQSANFAAAQLAGSVGPDFFTTFPYSGAGVFEPTPVTQISTVPTELSGTGSKAVFLQNNGDVSDTYTVHAAVTKASGDTSAISISASAPDSYGVVVPGADQTAALTGGGGYTVTIPVGDVVEFLVTDNAASATAASAPQVVFTATSQLDPAKVDSTELTFPTYFYRPDLMLSAPGGGQIGAGVYQQTYLGPIGNNQQAEYNIGPYPTTIDITLADRGAGPWPSNDAVVVKSPTQDPNFNVTYTLVGTYTSTDVTAAMEGAGLNLTLGPPGSPMPVIAMTISSSTTAQAGHPGWYPITVTSSSSLPAGLADVVEVGAYNEGQSQLRFGGLPQPEPTDITNLVRTLGLGSRVPPMPDAGYAPGVTYGAYPDITGQKFAYVSAYDTFDLQIASGVANPTQYRLQMVDPGTSLIGLPGWERDAFAFPYYNGLNLQTPADGLAAGASNIHPKFTIPDTNNPGGPPIDITAAVEDGTFQTSALRTGTTLNVTVSFTPPSASQRYIPIKFNLVNVTTGLIEDVLVIDPSSIVTCTSDGYQQVQASNGPGQKLNFEAFNRANPNDPSSCMEHLTHSWITTAPTVFGAYVPATATSPAGGDDPVGLWLVPSGGGIVQINTDTLTVTGTNIKTYVDSPLLNPDGSVLSTPGQSLTGYAWYYYLNSYPSLTWHTLDGTTGLAVDANTTSMPAAPFPLVTPDQTNWPNNTMGPGRYFQVDSFTGGPVMVGEMDVDVPWYHNKLPLVMDLDGTNGLLLNYAVPQNTPPLPLPGDNGVTFFDVYWSTRSDGTVVQGGCLGVPSELFVILGFGSGPNECIIGVTVTFKPISPVPDVEANVSQITLGLKKGFGAKGSPEFNLKSFSGEVDLDPATQDVTKVVVEPVFGVGPPTPCQLNKNAGTVPTGAVNTVLYQGCPSNYFFFDAKITYQQGGFDNGNPAPGGSGFGLQFDGTLTFLNVVTLANVEADISTSPFNFHFADSPIDLSITDFIPVTAHITFTGDVGADGFDIGVSGGIAVDGFTIASASGILSTKGIGVCGGLAGTDMGFGYPWGGSPTVYLSGCTTDQFQVQS